MYRDLGPLLIKKSFPVCWVGEKKASREVGILFFPNFIFDKLECIAGGGGGVKKTKKTF